MQATPTRSTSMPERGPHGLPLGCWPDASEVTAPSLGVPGVTGLQAPQAPGCLDGTLGELIIDRLCKQCLV